VGRQDSQNDPGVPRGRASVPGRPPGPAQEGYESPSTPPHQPPPGPQSPPPAPPAGDPQPHQRVSPPPPGAQPPTAQPQAGRGQVYGRASVAPPEANAAPAAAPWITPPPAAAAPWAPPEPVPAGPATPPGSPAAAPTGDQPGAGTGPRRTRRIAWVSVLAVVALLAGVAAFAFRPGPIEGWLAADPVASPTPAPTPEPTPSPVLAAADAGAVPTEAGVTAAIGPLVTAPALGSQVRVSVVDAVTGDALYERSPDTLTTPASTTKLLTAATVLAARGPAHRLATRAVAGAAPGEVVLIGGGDPTLAVGAKGQFPGAARLDKLAAQVEKALGGTAPTRVVIDTSLFTGPVTARGWSPGLIAPEGQVAAIQSLMTNAGRVKPVHNEVGGDPRFSDPALAAGRAFAKQLGVTAPVRRGTAPVAAAPASAAPSAAPVPAPGTELGRVESPPLVHLVDWMLEQSDNVIAEALARQVALAAGRPASFEGAAAAMIAKVGELGLPAAEVRLADASGLSRDNAITPSLLTDLLAVAASGRQPTLSSMFTGLPVAGWSGTLRTRFVTPAPNQVGQGLVRAKTGSLSGVHTISGALVTREGRVLVFAIMADRAGDYVPARQALDRIAARLVACGC
jgi:D-alanyl-D-alanine carboxypeptidase/D-alanyl-D-alanine-endopeptidase (penicillin-binding protein 4)